MRISTSKSLDSESLKDLFNSVGWDLDTPPEMLSLAMGNASHIVTAYDDSHLIGLIRSMDDGMWHANIDCLVVHKDYQRTGVGTQLLNELLKLLKDVSTISVSPNESKNFAFYEKFGFKQIEDGGLLQLYR